MSRRSGIASKSIDWITLTVFFSLLIIGWLMLYAAVYDSENPHSYLDFTSAIGKQTMWLGVALITFVIIYVIEWEFWNSFAFPIYAVGIVLLILVLLIGTEIKGARSWFSFFGFSFQPSEIVKFTTALAVSSFLSSYKVDIRNRNTLLIALGLIVLPILLIILQPDPGSGLIFLSFFILLYRRGLSPLVYILGFSIIGIFICSIVFDPKSVTLLIALIGLGILMYNIGQTWRSGLIYFAISSVALLFYIRDLYWYGLGIIVISIMVYAFMMFQERMFRTLALVLPSLLLSSSIAFGSSFMLENVLKPHQQDRINVWLRPEKSDPNGPRYNIIQSKRAIGSGGLKGKGFLQGDMTKLNYVPEQTTDFIFSTVGEEQGFIGSFGVIFLFTLLLARIVIIAERAKNIFIQNYAYAVAGILFIHFFVNIGMALGLMPVIGIPLPFLSKGGTALLVFTIMISVLLRMDMARFRV
ncbi:MAG: rod shape-determining protein RodA [Saprospiraceae bacterium]|nr:rod shape-determining protein RodA [Saprospiraceae bacterium]